MTVLHDRARHRAQEKLPQRWLTVGPHHQHTRLVLPHLIQHHRRHRWRRRPPVWAGDHVVQAKELDRAVGMAGGGAGLRSHADTMEMRQSSVLHALPVPQHELEEVMP